MHDRRQKNCETDRSPKLAFIHQIELPSGTGEIADRTQYSAASMFEMTLFCIGSELRQF